MNLKKVTAKRTIAIAVGSATLGIGLTACGGSADKSEEESSQKVTQQHAVQPDEADLAQEEQIASQEALADWFYALSNDSVVLKLSADQASIYDVQEYGLNYNGCEQWPSEYQYIIDSDELMPPVEPDLFRQSLTAYLEGIETICSVEAAHDWQEPWKEYATDAEEAAVNEKFDKSSQLQDEWFNEVTDHYPGLVDTDTLSALW